MIQELCVKGATNDSVVQAMMQASATGGIFNSFAPGQTTKNYIDLCMMSNIRFSGQICFPKTQKTSRSLRKGPPDFYSLNPGLEVISRMSEDAGRWCTGYCANILQWQLISLGGTPENHCPLIYNTFSGNTHWDSAGWHAAPVGHHINEL